MNRAAGAMLTAVLAVVGADLACAQSQHPTKGLFGRKQDGPVPDVDRDALTAEELKLDCKKLSGRMQIRIMQVRAETGRDDPTAVTSALQSVTKPLYGGSKYGIDPKRQTSRDRSWLEAANKQLAAKSCRTYDLETELKKPAGAPPPVLQPKPSATAPAQTATSPPAKK